MSFNYQLSNFMDFKKTASLGIERLKPMSGSLDIHRAIFFKELLQRIVSMAWRQSSP